MGGKSGASFGGLEQVDVPWVGYCCFLLFFSSAFLFILQCYEVNFILFFSMFVTSMRNDHMLWGEEVEVKNLDQMQR